MQSNKPTHTLTIEELREQETEILHFLADPKNTPDDTRVMTNVLTIIRQTIAQKSAPAPLPPEALAKAGEQIKHNTPPPTDHKFPVVIPFIQPIDQPTIPSPEPSQSPIPNQPITKINAGNQHPVHSQQPMSATIQADHHTNPHNPTVTITWADGYTFTGDETAIRGRFTTTFRDTLALRLVQQHRYPAMWRWSSPWRAAGFYQALTYFIGAPPTLQEIGIQRPNDLTRTIFNLITEKATVTAS